MINLKRRSLLGFLTLLGVAGPAGSTSALAIDVRDFGVTFDGKTDDTAAWKRLAASMAGRRGVIQCPVGLSIVTDAIAFPPDTILRGDGANRTTLSVRNGVVRPCLYGLICVDGLALQDIGFEIIDTIGKSTSWTAALGFAATARGMRFERVHFRGSPRKLGQWTGFIDRADVSDVIFRDCRFERLAAAAPLKGNHDDSNQSGWRWIGCRGTDCIDGLSINSPRGAWTNGEMTDCDFARCSQFPFAFAGPRCSDWRLRVSGRDNDFELIHIEDSANRFRIEATGERCNLRPGVGGSPKADNGFIQMIGGVHDIDVAITLDLAKAGAGAPNGVVIQAGGPRVSDGVDLPPHGIRISGTIVVAPGRQALIAYASEIGFEELRLINRSATNRTPALSMSGCRWSGRISVRNPGVLCFVDPRSTALGAWDQVDLVSDEADGFATLQWLSGSQKTFAIAKAVNFRALPPMTGEIILGPAPAEFTGSIGIDPRPGGMARQLVIRNGVIVTGASDKAAAPVMNTRGKQLILQTGDARQAVLIQFVGPFFPAPPG